MPITRLPTAFLISAFLVVIFVLEGCSTTSTVHFTDGQKTEIQVIRNDGEFLYGTLAESSKSVKVYQKDIRKMDFPGSGHIIAGSILTALGGGAMVMGMVYFVGGQETKFDAMMGLLGGAFYLGIGTPILIWGLDVEHTAQRHSGWSEVLHSIDAAPIVFRDGEENHYGIGFSGQF
jgi:hypothetical protein